MILFPAIDLKDGACVRLVRGEMDAATMFNPDPADQARRFVDAGCDWLHVVDLDGAFAGKAVNAKAVAAILDAANVPVQLGGGIRDDAVDRALARGRRRAASSSARSRCASRTSSRRRAGAGRARSSSASTRATATSRSRAGPRPRR